MSKKIVIPLFIVCTLFFNANLAAFASNTNEFKLQSFEKVGFELNYASLNSDAQVKTIEDNSMSGLFWGAGMGAVSGLFLGAISDAGNRGSIAPINIGTPLGFIFGLVIGGAVGAVFDAGKNSAKK